MAMEAAKAMEKVPIETALPLPANATIAEKQDIENLNVLKQAMGSPTRATQKARALQGKAATREKAKAGKPWIMQASMLAPQTKDLRKGRRSLLTKTVGGWAHVAA